MTTIDVRDRLITVADGLRFPEGPVALPGGQVAFVEIRGQRVTLFDGADHRPLGTVPGAPNGLALGPDGALYVANNGGAGIDDDHRLWIPDDTIDGCVQRITLGGAVSDHVTGLPGPLPHRLNDLCFAGTGQMYFTDSGNWEVFFAGVPDLRSVPPDYRHGALYLRDLDGAVHRLAEIPDFPNGLAITPDGERLVVAQTIRSRLLAYPLRGDGTVGEPEEYAQLPETVLPDGICFADDGTLYVAGSGGDRIAVLAPDGAVREVWDTGPGSSPTNVCLAGGLLWVTFGGAGTLARIEVEHGPA